MKNIMMLTVLLLLVSCNSKENEKVITKFQNSNGTTIEDEMKTPLKYQYVTTEFGGLSVQEGHFSGESSIIPWSSWWFPTKDRYMFENTKRRKLAPLEKYDLFVDRTYGDSPEAAYYEEMEIYDPSEVNWAGLCHAWAVASVLHPEPKVEISKKKIVFSVVDQKALLLKSYENVGNLQYFGDRYDGGFEDKFDDIYPDQFHRLAQVFIFEKKLPFLMDYDPSYPVWTVPVYDITFKITKEDKNTAHVKAWVTTASSFVSSPSYIGTKKSVKYYEYKLFGTWVGTKLLVTGSKWVNDAIYDHPDFLIAFPKNANRGSLNKNLDIAYIDEILGKM